MGNGDEHGRTGEDDGKKRWKPGRCRSTSSSFGQAGRVRESARICRDDERSLVYFVHNVVLLEDHRVGRACETLEPRGLRAAEFAEWSSSGSGRGHTSGWIVGRLAKVDVEDERTAHQGANGRDVRVLRNALLYQPWLAYEGKGEECDTQRREVGILNAFAPPTYVFALKRHDVLGTSFFECFGRPSQDL